MMRPYKETQLLALFSERVCCSWRFGCSANVEIWPFGRSNTVSSDRASGVRVSLWLHSIERALSARRRRQQEHPLCMHTPRYRIDHCGAGRSESSLRVKMNWFQPRFNICSFSHVPSIECCSPMHAAQAPTTTTTTTTITTSYTHILPAINSKSRQPSRFPTSDNTTHRDHRLHQITHITHKKIEIKLIVTTRYPHQQGADHKNRRPVIDFRRTDDCLSHTSRQPPYIIPRQA